MHLGTAIWFKPMLQVLLKSMQYIYIAIICYNCNNFLLSVVQECI